MFPNPTKHPTKPPTQSSQTPSPLLMAISHKIKPQLSSDHLHPAPTAHLHSQHSLVAKDKGLTTVLLGTMVFPISQAQLTTPKKHLRKT